jgi:hypothetical protein
METPADPENMIPFVSCMLSVAMIVVICTVNLILFLGSVAQVLVMSLRKSKRNERVPERNNLVYVTSTSLLASAIAFWGTMRFISSRWHPANHAKRASIPMHLLARIKLTPFEESERLAYDIATR